MRFDRSTSIFPLPAAPLSRNGLHSYDRKSESREREEKWGRQVDSLSIYPFSIGHYKQGEKDAAMLAIGYRKIAILPHSKELEKSQKGRRLGTQKLY